MPTSGKAWWHVQISTFGSWLPGDERGFRSHDHQIHSSGNYNNRPPRSEHAGLRTYHQKRTPNAVHLPFKLRPLVADALASSLLKDEQNILAVSVCNDHAQLLVELPIDVTSYKTLLGRAKGRASHQIRNQLPGKVWSHDDHHLQITDRKYHLRPLNDPTGHTL